MFHRWDDNFYETVAVSPRTVTTTTEIDGTAVDMRKYDTAVFIVQLASGTAWSGALTCYVAESTDNSTWSDTYLSTLTIASSTTADRIDTLEINAADLSDGYRYARVEINPADGTVKTLAAVNVQFNKRVS